MDLLAQVEAILFVASKPLTVQKISQALQIEKKEVEETLEILKTKYNHDNSGINILTNGEDWQMGTNPLCTDGVNQFVKEEISGELTKAQLETLTVVAYEGPVTRPEIEQIRGVNCALILRHLLMRGLIEEENDEVKLAPVYRLSVEALRHLGVNSVEELPEYEAFHNHEYIQNTLNDVHEEI